MLSNVDDSIYDERAHAFDAPVALRSNRRACCAVVELPRSFLFVDFYFILLCIVHLAHLAKQQNE